MRTRMKPRIRPFIGMARLKRQRMMLARIRPRRLFRKPAVLPHKRFTLASKRPMIWRLERPGFQAIEPRPMNRSTLITRTARDRADPSSLLAAHRGAGEASPAPPEPVEKAQASKPRHKTTTASPSPKALSRKADPPAGTERRQGAEQGAPGDAPSPREIHRSSVEEIGVRKADEEAPPARPDPEARPPQKPPAEGQGDFPEAQPDRELSQQAEAGESKPREGPQATEDVAAGSKAVQRWPADDRELAPDLRPEAKPEPEPEITPTKARQHDPAQRPPTSEQVAQESDDVVQAPPKPPVSSSDAEPRVLRKPQPVVDSRIRSREWRAQEIGLPLPRPAAPMRVQRQARVQTPDLAAAARLTAREMSAESIPRARIQRPMTTFTARPRKRTQGAVRAQGISSPDPGSVRGEPEVPEIPLSPSGPEGIERMILRKPAERLDPQGLGDSRELASAQRFDLPERGGGARSSPVLGDAGGGTRTTARRSLDLVQRAPAQPAAPEAPPARNETTEESAPEEVDLDKMAREVYAIVKRRLRVERERALGWGGSVGRR